MARRDSRKLLAALVALAALLVACSEADPTGEADLNGMTTTLQEPTTTTTTSVTTTTSSVMDEVAAFYAENPVTVVVNTEPGGLSDPFARAMARSWEAVTGGSMRIENEAGGGGLVAINQVAAQVGNRQIIGVGTIGPHALGFDLFGAEGAAYSALDLNYLAAFPLAFANDMLIVAADGPFETLDDLIASEQVRFPVPSPTSSLAQSAGILFDVLGIQSVILPGYRGADIGPAVAGGEGDAGVVPPLNVVDYLAVGFIKEPLLRVAFERSIVFPDTPALAEVVDLTEEQEQLLRLREAIGLLSGFFAPPGVEDEYVQYLRDTIAQALNRDEFIAEATGMWGIWDSTVSGEDVQRYVEDVFNSPPELVERLMALTASRVP